MQLPANAPLPMRIAAIQQEVVGHLTRGRQAVVANGDVAKAREEFRDAAQEVTNLVTVLPNHPAALSMRDSVTKSFRNMVLQCQGAQQRRMLKVADPNFRCASLVPGRFLGGRRGG